MEQGTTDGTCLLIATGATPAGPWYEGTSGATLAGFLDWIGAPARYRESGQPAALASRAIDWYDDGLEKGPHSEVIPGANEERARETAKLLLQYAATLEG